jgi:hypothetical protein
MTVTLSPKACTGSKLRPSSLQNLYMDSKDMSPDGSRSTIILRVDANRNTSRPAGLLTFHQNQLREFLKASFVVASAVALKPQGSIKWIAKDYHPEIKDPKASLMYASLPAESLARDLGSSTFTSQFRTGSLFAEGLPLLNYYFRQYIEYKQQDT